MGMRLGSRLKLPLGGLAVFAVLAFVLARGAPAEIVQVDTALVVSVDVSNSVDAERYKLQMEGIAQALEDPGVIQAITGGPNGAILFAMVTWADRPQITLPWTKIASEEDAKILAAKVRGLPLQGGEFTCMARMLRTANDKIFPQLPARALRVVIDVSGDGPDNCNADEPIDAVRDELVSNGVTINGLPILVGAEDDTAVAPAPAGEAVPAAVSEREPAPLETWFKQHVQGGNGSFVLPANGYGDFARAIRQKFVIEISGRTPPRDYASVSVDGGAVGVDKAVEAAR